MRRLLVGVVTMVGLLAASVWSPSGPAGALLPAHPAPCSWTFGPMSTQGALGTQVFQVQLKPATALMSCIQAVPMTSRITDATGAVPAGIGRDGGNATVTLLFSGGELPSPAVLVEWHAYCTTTPQPVFLHLSGAGMAAVYALGQSSPCSRGPAVTSSVDPPLVVSPDPAIGLAPTTGGGYRIAAVSGQVLEQPGAVIEAGNRAATPFVAIATATTGGFWLASADGGVYSYQGATFYGSAYGARLDAPVVGMAPTPTGHGYWLVAADGGVFSYGDAHFYGSAGSARLAAPVIGMAGDTATGGYWLGGADGGVFNYHAPFFGSAGGARLAAPVTGIAATATAGGYWLVAGDGGVFNYGNAGFHGTAASLVHP